MSTFFIDDSHDAHEYTTPHSSRQQPSDARASGVEIGTPFSTSRQMYWANVDGKVITSDSQSKLARMRHAPLSVNRVALALCSNLPSYLRQLPFWEGVETVPAGHVVRIHANDVGSSSAWSVTPALSLHREEAAARLQSLILHSVQRLVTRHEKVSSDVSGGIDSTSLAFFLRQFTEKPILYHASTADPQNRDTQYARRAAAEIGGDLVELASFTDSMASFSASGDAALPASDDGPLSWRSNAVHLAQLVADAASRGVCAHLVGLGGDELFSTLPTHILALRGEGSRWQVNTAARRLAKMQRWGRTSTLRAVASRETLGQELLRRARTRDCLDDEPTEAFAWAPGFGISQFATRWAAEAVTGQVQELVEAGVEPHFGDKYRHQVAESVKFQGEVIRQMNYVFRDLGVSIEAPFIDDDVLSLIFGLHPKLWTGSPLSKPLLAAAAGTIVPDWVFARSDKGEYSMDLFNEFSNRREELGRLFDDSYLVDHHYIDPDRVMNAINAPLLGTEHLFDLEHLASVEYWVRRVA